MATTLDPSTPGIALRVHHYVSNIETAHLGNIYSATVKGFDDYVVQNIASVAKSAMDNAPEWTYKNPVANSIQTHRTLSIALVKIVAIALFIGFVWWLHKPAPKTDPTKAGRIPEKAPPGPDGAKPNESTSEASDKKPDGTENPAKDANGAGHEEKTESGDKAPGKSGEIKDENPKTGTSSVKKSKDVLNPNPFGSDPGNPFDVPSSSASKAAAPLPPFPIPATGSGRGAPRGAPIPIYSLNPSAIPLAGKTPTDVVDLLKRDDFVEPTSQSSSKPLVGDEEEFNFTETTVEFFDAGAGVSPPPPPSGKATTASDLETARETRRSLASKTAASTSPKPPIGGATGTSIPTPLNPAKPVIDPLKTKTEAPSPSSAATDKTGTATVDEKTSS